jgi:hypothetical protein
MARKRILHALTGGFNGVFADRLRRKWREVAMPINDLGLDRGCRSHRLGS